MKHLWIALLLIGCGPEPLTMCGTAEAVELDPGINDRVFDALVHWENKGAETNMVVDDSRTDCDIPVRYDPDMNGVIMSHYSTALKVGTMVCSPHALILGNGWTAAVKKGKAVKSLISMMEWFFCSGTDLSQLGDKDELLF
jgi:hypothetical protein